MDKMDKFIEAEDYVEPRCVLCTDPEPKQTVPISRILQRVDSALSQNDYNEAERLLLYWYAEADACADRRGMLTLSNELMGLYRKLSSGQKAVHYAAVALRLCEELNNTDSTDGATAFLNAATVYKAFGQPEKAVELYKRCEAIYQTNLSFDDPRRGGLYNNYGLALVDLKDFAAAEDYFNKALEVMRLQSDGAPEQAITHLNFADLIFARDGAEQGEAEISQRLDAAEQLLEDAAAPRDGHYAFVCEKCASAFDFYGRFFYANQLKERAKAIYEGN